MSLLNFPQQVLAALDVESVRRGYKVGMSTRRNPFNFSTSTLLKITKKLNLNPFGCAIWLKWIYKKIC